MMDHDWRRAEHYEAAGWFAVAMSGGKMPKFKSAMDAKKKQPERSQELAYIEVRSRLMALAGR